jgi:hypothetical protein
LHCAPGLPAFWERNVESSGEQNGNTAMTF